MMAWHRRSAKRRSTTALHNRSQSTYQELLNSYVEHRKKELAFKYENHDFFHLSNEKEQ
jgi:hypothetical protein